MIPFDLLLRTGGRCRPSARSGPIIDRTGVFFKRGAFVRIR
jgi:hypothetical protein